MKTAGRENPNRWVTVPGTRVHGAAIQNGSRSITRAGKQEKLQPKGMCFFLTSPFIELHRTWNKLYPHVSESIPSNYIIFITLMLGFWLGGRCKFAFSLSAFFFPHSVWLKQYMSPLQPPLLSRCSQSDRSLSTGGPSSC